MKRIIDHKTFTSIVLILFLQIYICKSQEAFDNLFKSSKDRISEIVNQDYQIIHLELDRLNSNEKKETRISLYSGYRYVFAACGDLDRIKSVQIELFEESGTSRNSVQKGRDGKVPPGSSVIVFVPDLDKTYLVEVAPSKFASDNIANGRYYFIVASKLLPLEFNTISKEEAKFNLLTKKYVFKNSIENSSMFIISKEGNYIKQVIDESNTIEYIIKMTYSDEANTEAINCQVQGPDGKNYSFMIDRINKSIIILDQPGRNNVFTGYRYRFR
jgi:hypothetical protein